MSQIHVLFCLARGWSQRPRSGWLLSQCLSECVFEVEPCKQMLKQATGIAHYDYQRMNLHVPNFSLFRAELSCGSWVG